MNEFTSIIEDSARIAAENIRLSMRKRLLAPLDIDHRLTEFARHFGPELTVREFGLEVQTANLLAGKRRAV